MRRAVLNMIQEQTAETLNGSTQARKVTRNAKVDFFLLFSTIRVVLSTNSPFQRSKWLIQCFIRVLRGIFCCVFVISELWKFKLVMMHRSTLITDCWTKNGTLTINHFPYSPDLTPYDFYLFCKMLHLPMKRSIMRPEQSMRCDISASIYPIVIKFLHSVSDR